MHTGYVQSNIDRNCATIRNDVLSDQPAIVPQLTPNIDPEQCFYFDDGEEQKDSTISNDDDAKNDSDIVQEK